ncbi:MAG: hypothetical protein LBC02_08120 [Planctomycetaceae bacterium]|nr:hypothetical protein [Planctomycetaceae bacterium]
MRKIELTITTWTLKLEYYKNNEYSWTTINHATQKIARKIRMGTTEFFLQFFREFSCLFVVENDIE